MRVYSLILGDMLNCAYIVDNGGRALIVDPSWRMPAIYGFLEEKGLKPEAVVFTHGHYDHLHGAAELLEKYKIKAYIEESDAGLSKIPAGLLKTFKGDFKTDIIGLGAEFLHTPGHTPGSVCLRINGALFTGDTLFPGACGRTDLPGSNHKQMQQSLERLARLPPETIVYSGHAYGDNGTGETTIDAEVKTNPFIKLAL